MQERDVEKNQQDPEALVEGNEVAQEEGMQAHPSAEAETEPYKEDPSEDEKDRLDRHY